MKKQYWKRSAAAIIAFLLVFLLVSCGKNTQSQEESSKQAAVPSVKERIAAIDGVLSVEAVYNNQSEWLPERYIVMIEQQLDWNDPAAGTFPQRVEVGLHPGADVNILETSGYTLMDEEMTANRQPELCLLLNANHIRTEHRFSGISFPEGMNNYSTEGWEYLTTENEAGDYHHIYEILSQALDGQWLCYGRSRGGRACLDYARLYPKDMKGYVPFVGVNCNGLNDPRCIDFLNNQVGDYYFGKQEGARRRAVIENFLVECVKYRDQLEDLLWEAVKKSGYSFPAWVTKERFFDLTLLEFQTGFWQSDGDIQELEPPLALPDDIATEKDVSDVVVRYYLLLKYGDLSSYSHEGIGFEYYAGALINEGHYAMDSSQLRAVLKKAGLEDRLVIRPEEEKDYLRNILLNDDQKAGFTFVPGHYEALDQFAKTTDLKIVFIGGGLDPWSAVYVDGGDNPHFKRYIHPGESHHVKIADFDPEIQEEIVNTIKSWLQE